MVASDGDSINTCSDKIAFKARLRLTKPKPWLMQTIPHQISYTYFPTLGNSPAGRPAREFTIAVIVICIRSVYYRVPLFRCSVTKYYGVRLNSLHSSMFYYLSFAVGHFWELCGFYTRLRRFLKTVAFSRDLRLYFRLKRNRKIL